MSIFRQLKRIIQGLATAASLSAMLDGEASHITRHLYARRYTLKVLWVDARRA